MIGKIAWILLLAGTVFGQNLPIRAAFWDREIAVPAGLIERAKYANYNYMIVYLTPPVNMKNNWRNVIRDEFINVNGKGIRMIPFIQLSSKWCDHWWLNVRQNYPAMQFNVHRVNASAVRYSTSMAADPPGTVNGTDQAISDALAEIKAGFDLAKAALGFTYDLEYIHLGHDEPVENDWLLTGNEQNNISYSSNDWNYIHDKWWNKGFTVEAAYRMLFADEIMRRVKSVRTIIGASTKVMIAADLWDPQANGGLFKTVWHSNTKVGVRMVDASQVNAGQYGIGLATLPGLLPNDAAMVRSSLILCPWNYYYKWRWPKDPDADGKYGAAATYAYFAKNSFRFTPFGSNDPDLTGSPASLAEGTYAMQQGALYLKKYQGSYYSGYIAAYWPISGDPAPFWDEAKGIYDQTVPLRTLEYMHNIRVVPSLISTQVLY
jgi:hypothetical protein